MACNLSVIDIVKTTYNINVYYGSKLSKLFTTCTKRERSGSVVEGLTRDRGATGSSLTGVTALWSLSKTHLSQLSTGPTQEDCLTEKLLMGRRASNQTNKIYTKVSRHG